MRKITTTTTTARTRIAVRVLAVTAAAATATGCGNLIDRATEKAVEEGVERAIEADSGGDVEIDFDDNGISVESDEGDFTLSADEDGVQIEGTDADGNDFTVDADEGGVDIEGGDTSGSFEVDEDGGFTITDEDGEVVTGQTDDDGSFTIEGEDGESVFNSGPGVPEQWPDDVPVPEGLTDVNGTYFAENDLVSTTLIGRSSDPVDQVFADYTGQLEDAGFEQESSFTQGDEAANAVYVQGQRRVSVTVTSFEGGTDIAVAIG